MPWSRKLALFLPIAILVCTLDLWTKHWIESRIAHGFTEPVWGDVFMLANHRNPGGMWGVGAEWSPWILRIVRLGAVFVILYILKEASSRDSGIVFALGLVMGGAVGNIHDSLAYGYVRDFLRFDLGVRFFDPFPTFNIADSAICVGVGLLAILMFRQPADPATPATRSDRA